MKKKLPKAFSTHNKDALNIVESKKGNDKDQITHAFSDDIKSGAKKRHTDWEF